MDTVPALQPNAGKNLTIELPGGSYARLPIRTHVVTVGDTMSDLIGGRLPPRLGKKL